MADATDLKSVGIYLVGVRVPPWAPYFEAKIIPGMETLIDNPDTEITSGSSDSIIRLIKFVSCLLLFCVCVGNI